MKKSHLSLLVISLLFSSLNARNLIHDFKTINETKQSKDDFIAIDNPSITSDEHFLGSPLPKLVPLKAKVDVELLDSVIIINSDGLYSRTDYIYDNQGNKTAQISSAWQDDPGIWVGTTKYEYVHGISEDNDKTLIETYYLWDSEAALWVEQEQYDNVFHQQTNLYKIRITKNWDVPTSSWVPQSKLEQYLDDDDYDLTTSSYIWDNTNNKWKGESKIGSINNEVLGFEEQMDYYYSWGEDDKWQSKMTIEFNKKGEVISEAIYQWVNAEAYWKGISKSSNQFNAEKELHENIEYLWDDVSKLWINNTMIESTYDYLDRPTYLADYVWDAANSRWIGQHFFQKSYTDSGQTSLEKNYTWHPVNNIWILTNEFNCTWEDAGDGNWGVLMKIEMSYNLAGLAIERIQFYRSNLQSPWDLGLTWKGEYLFDENDLNYQILFYSWDEVNETWVLFEKSDILYTEKGSMLNRIDYALVSDSWVMTGEKTYYYSSLVSDNKIPAYTLAMQTYPNPAEDVVVVSGTKYGQLIRVLHVDGSLLGTCIAQDKKTEINLSGYTEGVLLLNIENETMKIMKVAR